MSDDKQFNTLLLEIRRALKMILAAIDRYLPSHDTRKG